MSRVFEEAHSRGKVIDGGLLSVVDAIRAQSAIEGSWKYQIYIHSER